MIFNRLVFATLASSAAALNNGIGKLPKMGYDTFNAFACTYDAATALAQAQAMMKHGLVAAGYNSFILDDCYTLKSRSSEGMLVAGG
jgi:alpha-galactosidase